MSVVSAPRRRLSSRRGSNSAPDPYGINFEADTARGSSARITIVPVAPQVEQQPRHSAPRDRTSWGSSTSSNASTGRGRLSFAHSSFTPINGNKNGGGGESSPTRAQAPPSPGRPNLKLARSNSNGSVDRAGYAVGRGQKLTPEQICDLAVSSIASPGPISPTQEKAPAHTPFLLLSEEQYLPFLERPAEVTALLTSSPTSRLMMLLSQTFAADMRAPYDATKVDSATPFGSDPTKWNFAELTRWLQTVDRHQANDREWVMKTRRCVLARSELIWSRLKAALGVPPELEEEEEDGGDEHVADYDFAADDHEAYFEPIYPGERVSCVASPITSPSVFNVQNGGMESIGERAEDEEEDEKSKAQDAGSTAAQAIQGLRISAPMVERDRPVSPTVPMRRSHSTNAAADDAEARRRQSLALAGPSRVRRSTQQEQGTGAPLFPSSFATLTMGPSLVAK